MSVWLSYLFAWLSYSFAWAVVKGYHSMGGLHNRNVLSHWLEVQDQWVDGIGSF